MGAGPDRVPLSECPAPQPRWCVSPPPLHTPTPGSTGGQGSDESGQHGGTDPNFLTYSPRTSMLRNLKARLRRSGAAAKGGGDRPIHGFRDTPIGYMSKPLADVSAGQRPTVHVVAGEGSEPSKLSR